MEDDTAPYALVVDDEPLILMDACDILSDAGFRPLEASDVDEAIGILEEHAEKVTLLFTDVQMPGGRDGFDLAREAARRWPEIRTLVASGRQHRVTEISRSVRSSSPSPSALRLFTTGYRSCCPMGKSRNR